LCAAILDRRNTVPAPPFSTAVNRQESRPHVDTAGHAVDLAATLPGPRAALVISAVADRRAEAKAGDPLLAKVIAIRVGRRTQDGYNTRIIGGGPPLSSPR
jgi:predicted dehydrogenase